MLALSAAVTVIAIVTTRAVLTKTGGEPAVPLDDTYIHFQYARAFSELRPFEYTPGAEPTAGATSLLWPVLLAPFAAILSGGALVWAAWAVGWLAFGLLAYETYALGRGLVASSSAIAAGLMALLFGGFVWFAGSGMEVIPFAWLLTRTARRSAEWLEAERELETRRFAELGLLALACTLMRPEGFVGAGIAAAALVVRPHAGRRAWALLPALSPLVPLGIYLVTTGRALTTTAAAKWLPLSPYYRGGALLGAIWENLRLLATTLLDGQIWTALFLPSGCGFIVWAGLGSVVVAGWLSNRRARGLCILALALGIFVPATYETLLVNRVRYIWPFASAWIVGVAALADLVGRAFERAKPSLGGMRALAAGAAAGVLASRLPASIDDLATSSYAVTQQQVSLARWAKSTLPGDSVLGVNDTGALAYYSGLATFDLVGLTTAGEARYWRAGPGSRFEHYEWLGRDRLPTHFVVYPEWLDVPPLLGQWLTERTVQATILGGTTMVARRARYEGLGSAERPTGYAARPVDRLDVADLESEEEHDYRLMDATQQTNVVVERGEQVDGGRSHRSADRFVLKVAGGGRLVARLGAAQATRCEVSVRDRVIGHFEVGIDPWQELELEVPASVSAGPHPVEVRALPGTHVTSMHYWSYGK